MIIMERIKNIYKKLVFAIVFISGMFLTSCTDFLTIIPPSMVVHEDFWHTEAEVNGMMATAYLTLCNRNCLSNAIVWGETRAETVDYPTGSTNESILRLTEGLLYDDNGYASWSEYYKAINYCNLVMEFGPTVLQHDPNFTEGEMDVVRGQMLALRAYAHFVLLRAFCNIPMATEVVINDAEIPEYPQVHPMDALQSMYDDLETASHLVLRSGINNTDNLGYMTTNAVYSLMADINMWQAAFAAYYTNPETTDASYTPVKSADEYYDMAIANCKMVMDAMDAIHEEHYTDKLSKPTAYNLLANNGLPTAKEAGYSSVYEAIFGEDMNSRESIFEFQIDDKNYAKGSSGISSVFGSGGNTGGLFVVQKDFLSTMFEDDDLRKYAFTTFAVADGSSSGNQGSDQKVTETYVAKFTAKDTPTQKGATRTYRSSDDYDAHWIMYRKTEIMLMKAEALVSRTSPTADDIKEAFDMTVAINKRWRMDTMNVRNEINFSEYSDKAKCLQLVRDERARELCFEGRRWYDIVRMALQNEPTAFSYNKKRHDTDAEEMLRRYSHISAYFMPIAKDELRFNSLLEQNKSCRTSDDDSSISQN